LVSLCTDSQYVSFALRGELLNVHVFNLFGDMYFKTSDQKLVKELNFFLDKSGKMLCYRQKLITSTRQHEGILKQ